MVASLIACAALIIPTTTLAPNVDAYADSRAASFSIGGLDQFCAAISNNCAEATAPAGTEAAAKENAKTTDGKKADADKEGSKTAASESKETSANEEKSASSKSAGADKSSSKAEETKADTAGAAAEDDETAAEEEEQGYSGGYLVDIDYPDYSYNPSPVSLSAYDRAKTERLVMGEAGSMGYLGCALVAQSIRDAMNRSNTTSIDQIISQYQYFGSTAIEPNADVKDAVSFIFDENGAAVQHRVMCFYTGTSAWHETQQFIMQVDNVRFFDLNV